MIKVVRGNVILRVPDDKLDYYVDKGFTAKTLDGQVIKEAIPTDLGTLRAAYITHTQKIKELEATIADLKKAKEAPVSTTVDEQPKPRKRTKKTED